MEAAIEPDNEEDKGPDAGGVIVACNQLREVRRRTSKGWKDDEEVDSDDDNDEMDITNKDFLEAPFFSYLK